MAGDADGDVLRFEGTVVSFSSTTLEIEDGVTFVITGDTKIKGALSEGAEVRVDAEQSNGDLVATKIKVAGAEDEEAADDVDEGGKEDEEKDGNGGDSEEDDDDDDDNDNDDDDDGEEDGNGQ